MLSEREQHELEDIEHQLALDDPDFVRVMHGRRPHSRLWQRAAAIGVLIAWVIAITIAVVGRFWIVGDVLMAAAFAAGLAVLAIWIVSRLRRRRAFRLAA
ncbi:MAG TPA: DUF3040 domain-containing protein [Micromonosporaceae bacterium]|jgi:Flp pilus assembly protein TadB|nr:DUF3040 domain-containing protein [Mycobacterium sp.]